MPPSKKPARAPLTHFLCIPLVTPASRPVLAEALSSFRVDVTGPRSLGGLEVPPDAIRPVGTLHLTLGMMSFPGGEDLPKAVELLRSLKPREILASVKPPVMPGAPAPEQEKGDVEKAAGKGQQGTPLSLSVTLKGLHSMQRELDKTAVLYAPPVDKLGILQGFCERIAGEFKEAGLMVEDDRPLLLHATIVNTIYVRGTSRAGKDRGKDKSGRRRWDKSVVAYAREAIDRYEDHVWLENFPIRKLAICRMGAKALEVDGEEDQAYEVEAEIDF
ncbi:hypothetical protein NKR23_g7573 [Pleurostoma richardsiae]|jgi:activating signal cointegrator complex subunit 1|uniref:A-kinase anchor protein 7-like phosphoesterase domain-containing protein n=1 Tax=Pleurostoma richardsiae TaxID=41990 RepID=A0AA38VQV5_9PEZI|nr:hypothetical protein NKR23_g7573 [Pleurostoma richardsiae]